MLYSQYHLFSRSVPTAKADKLFFFIPLPVRRTVAQLHATISSVGFCLEKAWIDLSTVIWLCRCTEVKQMWTDQSGWQREGGLLLPTPSPKDADVKHTHSRPKTETHQPAHLPHLRRLWEIHCFIMGCN